MYKRINVSSKETIIEVVDKVDKIITSCIAEEEILPAKPA